jgi:HpaII restriction endonuclease
MPKDTPEFTGNIGEFSEPYVVARLLVDGVVPVVDGRGVETGSLLSVLGVRRSETANTVYIQRGEDSYHCEVNEERQPPQQYGDLRQLADALLIEMQTIKVEKHRMVTPLTFVCPSAKRLLKRLYFSVLKAKSLEKSDLEVDIVDPLSLKGTRRAGFTIKSMLGSAPSLVNAGATVFTYEVSAQNEALDALCAEGLSGKGLVKKLFSLQDFQFRFCGVSSKVFGENLRMIDSLFERMLAAALFCSYRVPGGHFEAVTKEQLFIVELEKICGRSDNTSFFIHKMKDFLKQSALGMQPSKPWAGTNEVTGGALIVRDDGKLVCLCTDRDSDFRDYLYGNSRFETPKSGKGEERLCTLHKATTGKYYMRLSLQIRFKKPNSKDLPPSKS